MIYEVREPGSYLRRHLFGDDWRILMPLGITVTRVKYPESSPITLRIWIGDTYHDCQYWTWIARGDTP